MNYDSILKELYSLESPKIKLGLSRILGLLDKIGNPQRGLKCIHVGGTNGKGSVCAFLHSILKESKYKTGLYTSPHLKKFNERIRINDEMISDKDIVRLYQKIKPHLTDQSFFEITTAMAFLYFFEKKVDIVVLEVGLGGRLDATNVITPLVSVITNIWLEHTEILGNTLEKIAYEKSGIIKRKIPLVTGATGSSLLAIKKYANKKNSPLVVISNEDIHSRLDKKTSSWALDYKNYKSIVLQRMKGFYQVKNAAMALEVCDILSSDYTFNLDNESIKKGISNASWPARMELRGNILIDCAHNPAGIEALMEELSYFKYAKLIMVLGFSNDKDIKAISSMIIKKASTVILTQASNPKAAKIESIQPYFSNPILIKNPKNALQYAKKTAKKEDLIVVCGSIYMAGEVL